MKCSFILFNQLIVVMEKYKALYFLNVFIHVFSYIFILVW